MNYLAHLYLAGPEPEARLGALLGDFVFGQAALADWGALERREIVIHRRVDRYTDEHPQVVAARRLFAHGRQRYAGIALDVYYDHCLARDWARYCDTPLDAFTASFYRYLLSRQDELPERLRRIAPLMASGDWLGSYRRRDSVDLAVTRIATRLSRNGDRLVACLEDLRRHETEIAAGFDLFFPQLAAYASSLRGTYLPAGH